MKKQKILVAGATGDLGTRLVKALRQRGTEVRAVIRKDSSADKIAYLQELGAEIVEVSFANPAQLIEACSGVECVVSTLSGLAEVIIGVQSSLIDAAIAAKVERFIPSDFATDFTKADHLNNRNLELRKSFYKLITNKPIRITSILNGAFTELLLGKAPFILYKQKRILCWGDCAQKMDFTSIDDTAEFTAAAALDQQAPRLLRIAGDQVSAIDLVEIASDLTGKEFKIFRPGNLNFLKVIIKITKILNPARKQLYPAWQGMQYMHNMFSGNTKLENLDNDRYENIKFKSVRELLASR